MPDDRSVREVSWHDLFPWLLLARTCRLSAEFRKLLTAAAGIVCTALGWWIISAALLDAPDAGSAAPPQGHRVYAAPRSAPFGLGADAPAVLVPLRETARAFAANWLWATAPVRALFAREFTFTSFLAALLAALWAIVVWAFFGGILSRIAAVQLGLEERLSLASAARFAVRKCRAYIAAPLLPLFVVVLLVLPLAIMGAFLRFDIGVLMAGIFWPLALLFGVLIMLVVAGLALGFPLMWATISTDATDSFDAISRGYSYVGQRPLNYLFYALVSLAIGVVGWIIINTLAALAIYLTGWGASWGSGEPRWQHVASTPAWMVQAQTWLPIPLEPVAGIPSGPQLRGVGRAGAGLIAFWTGCVRLLALSYAYSFFWTAATGIYLLLRRDADATELDEVFVEGEDDPSSLPPVQSDSAGVSVLADETAEPQEP